VTSTKIPNVFIKVREDYPLKNNEELYQLGLFLIKSEKMRQKKREGDAPSFLIIINTLLTKYFG